MPLLKLEKRQEETLTATHFAANLLDPEQKGAFLTDAENLLAVECVIFYISTNLCCTRKLDNIKPKVDYGAEIMYGMCQKHFKYNLVEWNVCAEKIL